jgi:diaminohydroxyphosphoribosylaminopyrimidine deaminase / 5-amino-6-(5-phosphoribosylamino)uracil reductase
VPVDTVFSDADHEYMRAALDLAREGLGRTAPNPTVGCVVVAAGQVVGQGATQPGGRPHAETEALAQAGAAAVGATAYVTLEPCSHHGKTPPCADALVRAKVARVVVACGDPDPRVAGKGLERLRAAGIQVDVGLLEAEAEALNEGFMLRVRLGRPMVTLKLATSLDGKIAAHTGHSQWITGGSARAMAHRLRAEHDAILIGVNTAITDDPALTCRLPGLEDRSPLRVVLDGRLRLPLTSTLVRTANDVPTLIFCVGAGLDTTRVDALRSCGVKVAMVGADVDGQPDAAAVLSVLADSGVTRLLVEGGARVAAALIRADLVDRIAWFRAPIIIGGDGLSAVAALGLDRVDLAPRFSRLDIQQFDTDMLETLRRNPA